MAPLLANLRGYFAEFLNDRALERLRIFTSPTCVSLGTVTTQTSERGFSRTDFQSVRLTAPPNSEITSADFPTDLPSSGTDIYKPADLPPAVTPRCKRLVVVQEC